MPSKPIPIPVPPKPKPGKYPFYFYFLFPLFPLTHFGSRLFTFIHVCLPPLTLVHRPISQIISIIANLVIAEAPGSQYNGGVWCGSPKLVTTRLPSGEVVSVWGVPPKPGEETLPMLPPAKKPKDKKKKK
ncbi:hypothetical protein E4U61_003531 [Claviceps capensis]|nr:hypothetical protein E4U61_003531 [Claviceps capensis]